MFLLLAFLGICLSEGCLYAQHVTEELALQKALVFMQNKVTSTGGRQKVPRKMRRMTKAAENDAYYVFNIEENGGFVIVSGDERTDEILGYSTEGNIDLNKMPENMKAWLKGYEEQILTIPSEAKTSPAKVKMHSAVEPLLTTKWNQGDPYNQNCPDFFNNGKCLTGCVATAMAQVMYYHRAMSITATTRTIPPYDCYKEWTSSTVESLGHIHSDAIPTGSLIEWDNMLSSYNGSESTIQQQAVANLMKYCGAAVKMEYSNSASSASSEAVPGALMAFFNYSSETVLKYRSNYSSDDWDNLIYTELSNLRPVYYSGSNSSVGHAFVCDGYDGNGYYHINWGWGGLSDGYFLLSALDPNEQGAGGSSSGYNNSQAALINAEPRNSVPSSGTDIDFADGNVKQICLQYWDIDGDGKLSIAESAIVKDLKSVFKNNWDIILFDELQFFTGLKNMADSSFYDCKKLISVTIPSCVTNIGDNAFDGCSRLSSILIPSSVTSIGANAFNYCTSLTSLTIPSSVTTIGEGAFGQCNNLSSITVDSNNTIYDSRNNCNAIIKTSTNTIITGCKNTVIPSSVKCIGDGAFLNSGVTSISIPANITNIGQNAFGNCSNLSSITVDSNNTVYDSRNDCNAIIESSSDKLIAGCGNTIIPSSVISIGEKAFYLSSISSIEIPSSVTTIDDGAFAGCLKLSSIHLPKGIKTIGKQAFSECGRLKTINIPASVTTIGDYAFDWCYSLSSVIVEWTKPITISENTFSNRANATLYVPYGSMEAYKGADYWKEFKEIVELSANNINFTDANVKTICVANWDMNGDKELNESEAALVLNLGDVFKGNTEITSFNELQYFTGVTNIGRSAFSGCTGMMFITIPMSVTNIEDYAFNGCSNLTFVTIGNRVSNIGCSAFRGCTRLVSINLPSSLSQIGSFAFENCTSLASINLPSSVTSVGVGVFSGCSSLASISLPSNISNIGWDAFSGCSSLASISLPSSVSYIGKRAFEDCHSLACVKSEIKVPSAFGKGAFNSISNKCVLTVPVGTRDAYIAAGWTEDVFKGGVVEMPEKDTDISELNNVIYVAPFTVRVGDNKQMQICLKNAEEATAYVFDLVLPEGVTVAKNCNGKYIDELSDRHDDHTHTFNYKGENTYGLSTLSGNSEPLTGNDGPIRLVTIEASDNMAEGNYAIDIKNASYSKPDGTLVSLPDTRAIVTVEDYVLGDVNGNGGVDIGDAVSIVNYLVGKDSSNFVAKAADTNKNGQIDIGDAVTIVNLLVGKIPNFTREFNFILDEKEPE